MKTKAVIAVSLACLLGASLLACLTVLLFAPSDSAETAAIDFESAVRAVVTAEGPLPELEPPKELCIISAKYGARDTWTDITEKVKAEVVGSTLEMRSGNNLVGGDPLFGVPKTLRIEYEADGKRGTAVAGEGDTCRIPSHDSYDALQTITTAERLAALAESCPAEIGLTKIGLL